MSKPVYLEDFAAGQVREFGSYHVTAEEIVAFASRYDPQPFHVDEAAAAKSIYGGLIGSGWMTCAIAMRMVCGDYVIGAASMARRVSTGSGGSCRCVGRRAAHAIDGARGQAIAVEAGSRNRPLAMEVLTSAMRS